MRKQRNKLAESTTRLRLWTYAKAVNAVPYIREIVRSLRDHWLETHRACLKLRRIDARHGRPDRRVLDLRVEAVREVEEAKHDLEETLRELRNFHVFSLDPVQGLALMPFAHGDELAWFVFDLFAPLGVEAWRLHTDAHERRRPLAANASPALWLK